MARTWEEADEDRYFYPNPYRPAWKKGLAQWDYLNYDDFENPPTHGSRTRAEAAENPGFQPSAGKTRAQPGKSGHSGSVSGEQPLSATLPYHPTQPPTLQYLRSETREAPSENGGAAGWLAALATPVLDWFRGRSSDAETDNGGAARSDGGFTSGLGAERMPDTKTSDLDWAEHRWGWLMSDGEKLTRFLTDDAYRAKQELAALRGGVTAQFADAQYLTEEEKAHLFDLAGQGLFDEALAYYSQFKDTLAQRTGQRSAEMILSVENPLLRGVATTGLGLDAGMNQSLTGLAQAGNRLTGETALLPQPAAVYANELVRPSLSGLPALASDTAYQAGFQMPGFLANQVLPGAGALVTGAARGGNTYGQQRRAGRGELTSLLAAGVDAVGIDNILRAGLQTMQENGILLPGGTQPTDPTPAPSPAADTPSATSPNAVTSPLFPTEGVGDGLSSKIYTPVEYKGTVKVNGEVKDVSRRVYQRNDIVTNYFDETTGLTNLERMQAGKPPIGTDGNPVELHHVLQQEAGPMAELREITHQQYYSQLHGLVGNGASFRNNPLLNKQYNNFRYNYWKWRASLITGGK